MAVVTRNVASGMPSPEMLRAPHRVAQEVQRDGQQADAPVEQPLSEKKNHDAREQREQVAERDDHPLLRRKNAAAIFAGKRNPRHLESGGQQQGPERRVQDIRMLVDHRIVFRRFLDQAPQGDGSDALRDEMVARGQVAAELAVIHRLRVLEAVKLRGGVQQHDDQDAEAIQAELDQAQADADVDVVNEILDLGFKRFRRHTFLSLPPLEPHTRTCRMFGNSSSRGMTDRPSSSPRQRCGLRKSRSPDGSI